MRGAVEAVDIVDTRRKPPAQSAVARERDPTVPDPTVRDPTAPTLQRAVGTPT
ncbi:MAG TPA: hypothetical protein VMZ06_15885 [Candidatus Bathyarchaeia archaeon]|nr:hypothetical protein [Candidatus Bathyarchaeia archaeon]